MEKEGHTFKEKLAEACRIPKEVVLGYSLVSISGNKEIIIENYRGILEYNKEYIRVSSKKGQIKISGSNLNIEYLNNEEMKITGRILGIEYL